MEVSLLHLSQTELFDKLERALSIVDGSRAIADICAEVPGHDLAEALLPMPEEQILLILNSLDPAAIAELLLYLEYADQYRLLDHMPATSAQSVLAEMPSDALVDLLAGLHPRQVSQLLGTLGQEREAQIRELMSYPPNTAGGLMTDGYVAVRQNMTTTEVLQHVRKVGDDAETVSYVYVVDKNGRLTGVVSLRELVLGAPDSPVREYMTTSVVTVPVDMDQEEVAEVVAEYNFVAVPVVARENHLVGIITVDDVIDVIAEEATEDAYRFAATAAPTTAPGQQLPSVWAMAKPRLPWLISLLFLELGSGYIVNVFSDVVTPTMAVLLALFTVVMAGVSGNAATQALVTYILSKYNY
jgi:magnesium transporter